MNTNEDAKNVFSKELQICSNSPLTGYQRDGYCHTGPADSGSHVVCSKVTKEFLEYTKSKGNDLITPKPDRKFPGLKAGDNWCLCGSRWKEALDAGVAPPVNIAATHKKALDFASLETLQKYAK